MKSHFAVIICSAILMVAMMSFAEEGPDQHAWGHANEHSRLKREPGFFNQHIDQNEVENEVESGD